MTALLLAAGYLFIGALFGEMYLAGQKVSRVSFSWLSYVLAITAWPVFVISIIVKRRVL